MKAFVKNLIERHKYLIGEIETLNDFLYSNNGLNYLTDINNNKTQEDLFNHMTEYANKAIYLRSLKTALLSVECELSNNGIYFEGDSYLERIDSINNHKIRGINGVD